MSQRSLALPIQPPVSSLPPRHGIRALQGVAACCQGMVCEQNRGSTFVVRWSAQAHAPADQNGRLPPSGIVRRSAAPSDVNVGVGYQPTVWWSVQESNLRQPDSESGALPTELTDVDVLWSEPIHGTGRTKPCRVTCMPLDKNHQRPSITGWWLEAGDRRKATS